MKILEIIATTAMLAGTSSGYRLQLFDGGGGTTRIHDAGGSSSLSCWDLTATANNKASYISWSVPAGQRCTLLVYDGAGCTTYLTQWTASFNAQLPTQYNNKITSYRINCN